MVYYLNESNKSILDLQNECSLSIDEAVHEYEMSILSDKYNFICENGYEMPINEAEEKKQGFFKQLIQRIKAALKNLRDKLVAKLNGWIDKHPASKIKPFIEKIKNIFDKSSKKLDTVDTPEEAKETSNDASEEMKNTAEEAQKEIKDNKEEKISERKELTPEEKEYQKYVNSGKFKDNQLGEIKCGIDDHLDVSKYADPEFDYYQMHGLYRLLKNGIDISIIIKYMKDPSHKYISINDMDSFERIIKNHKSGYNIINKILEYNIDSYINDIVRAINHDNNEYRINTIIELLKNTDDEDDIEKYRAIRYLLINPKEKLSNKEIDEAKRKIMEEFK